jgi:hypothetical protein
VPSVHCLEQKNSLSPVAKDCFVSSHIFYFIIQLNTDWEKYGGSTPEQQIIAAKKRDVYALTLPPFSGILLSSC